MTNTKIPNRYVILIFAACVQFCYGIAYVWSIFQPYAIQKYNLDTSSANLPFGIMLGVFTFGNLAGGYLQKKLPVRLLILGGSAVLCLGLFLSAYVPVSHPWLLNITYGCITGFGCGVAYNTMLATMQKWFPDKRGMVTGIIICSAGLFGLIMNPIANSILEQRGFKTAMVSVAAILFLICFTLGWFIKTPPIGYKSDVRPKNIPVTSKQYTMAMMIRTKQYYILTITFMLAVPAYFLMNPMLMSLGKERGLSTGLALFGVMLVSVLNTTGRLVTPWLSDRIGRKNLLLFLFLFNMMAIAFLTVAKGDLFLIFISCIAFSYGGFMGMYPTISSDYFGMENAGMNYGIVMIGYAISSIGCPYLVRAVQGTSMGTAFSFVIAAIASVVGFLLMISLKKPE